MSSGDGVADVDSSEGLIVLNSFFDAFEAGQACQFLEEHEIPFVLKNFSVRLQGADRFREGPAIRMEVLISPEDLEQAKACLREKMGLFPEREIDERKEDNSTDDDEVLSQAIMCDALADAQSARDALSESGIRSIIRRMVDDEDGTVSYSVEVKDSEIERAIRVMDQWIGSR